MPEMFWEALAAAADNPGCRALRETARPIKTKNPFSPLPVTNNTDEDDVDNVIEALGNIAHTISSGPPLTHKQRKQHKRAHDTPPPYTQEQLKTTADAANSGQIALPDLGFDCNKDFGALRSLVDAGSSINAIDAKNNLPGAKVKPPPPSNSTYATANGKQISDRGQVTSPARTQDGDKRTIVWQKFEVDMPVLSNSGLCPGQGDLAGYHKDGGLVYTHQTKDLRNFIRGGKVYFMQIYVLKSLTQPKGESPPPPAPFAKAAGHLPKAKA